MFIVACTKRFCASFRFPVWALMKVPTECLNAWKPEAPDGRGIPSLSRTGYSTSFRSTSGSNGKPSFLQKTKSLGFFRSAASRCLFNAETSKAPRLIVRMLPFVFGAINCPRQRLCSICICSFPRSTCFHCRPRISPARTPVRARHNVPAHFPRFASLGSATKQVSRHVQQLAYGVRESETSQLGRYPWPVRKFPEATQVNSEQSLKTDRTSTWFARNPRPEVE